LLEKGKKRGRKKRKFRNEFQMTSSMIANTQSTPEETEDLRELERSPDCFTTSQESENPLEDRSGKLAGNQELTTDVDELVESEPENQIKQHQWEHGTETMLYRNEPMIFRRAKSSKKIFWRAKSLKKIFRRAKSSKKIQNHQRKT